MKINTITANEVTEKVLNNEELFILDVRNEGDFEDWKIEGKNFNYLNAPYVDLKNEGVKGILNKIPSNQDVAVVCAKGRSSMIVAEMLAEEGLTVSSLE